MLLLILGEAIVDDWEGAVVGIAKSVENMVRVKSEHKSEKSFGNSSILTDHFDWLLEDRRLGLVLIVSGSGPGRGVQASSVRHSSFL